MIHLVGTRVLLTKLVNHYDAITFTDSQVGVCEGILIRPVHTEHLDIHVSVLWKERYHSMMYTPAVTVPLKYRGKYKFQWNVPIECLSFGEQAKPVTKEELIIKKIYSLYARNRHTKGWVPQNA